MAEKEKINDYNNEISNLNNKENETDKKDQNPINKENFSSKLKIFEDRVQKRKALMEEEKRRQRLYEQNRKNSEKMRELKEFIKQNKEALKGSEVYFEEHKEFFSKYDILNYIDFQNLIRNYRYENYKLNLEIEHIKNNDLIIIPEKKKFDKLNIELTSTNNNNYILIERSNNNFKSLQICKQENEINNNPDIKKYINDKIKIYEIKNVDSEEFNATKKMKYNEESELIESSITSFNYEKNQKNLICNGENIVKNGISSEELINTKIKTKIIQNFSEQEQKNYEKLKEIYDNVKNIKKNESIIDNIFCLNCNYSIQVNESMSHNNHSIIQIDKNYKDIITNETNDLDYNEYLNKLYEHLKKNQKKILASRNIKLIKYFGKLLFSLYEITINNNNIDELNSSIINIYENYIKERESKAFNEYLYEYFLYYITIIIELACFKEKKIETIIVDLEDEYSKIENDILYNEEKEEIDNNNKNYDELEELMKKQQNLNDNLNISIKNKKKLDFNFDEFSEKERRKYFLKLGIDMKNKYGKNESINDLYSKAKENNIDPYDYENFLMKELNLSNFLN